MRIALIVALLTIACGCAAHRKHCRYVTRTEGYTQYVCEGPGR